MNIGEMIETARAYRSRAYAPVSQFTVGAALKAKSGRIYGGCNIENAVHAASLCAERTAFAKAVSEGEQEFEAIVVIGGARQDVRPGKACPPCGICRQVMAEFCGEEFQIILPYGDGNVSVYTLAELLPVAFRHEGERE